MVEPPPRRQLAAIVICLSWMGLTEAWSQTTRPESNEPSVAEEVLANILNQPVGDSAVRDFNLPAEFLHRLADRVIQSSFEERHRIVVRDAEAQSPERTPATNPQRVVNADASNRHHPQIRVLEHEIPEDVLAYWRSLPEVRPPLRGFRAPLSGTLDSPFIPVREFSGIELGPATDLVAKHLSHDGLLLSAAHVIEAIGPSKFLANEAQAELVLRLAGIPTDLLNSFSPPAPNHDHSVMQFIATQLTSGETVESLKPKLDAFEFHFHQSEPGFRVATESGEHEIGMIRLQLTRGSYWRGMGDGGNADLARQLIEQLPGAHFVISIEERHVHDFMALVHTWMLPPQQEIHVITEPLPLAQWAQDNGKAGFISASDGSNKLAVIAPRYASRSDDGSTFVPGESLVMSGLSAAGVMVIQSSLLFQGGNLLAVRHPHSGRRILLLGEAEIYRNIALGLTTEQVLQAFAIEFGVDEAAVLPAVSFHIDYDFSVRADNGRLIAIVNNPWPAVRIILECGVDVLESHGIVDAETAREGRDHLAAGRWREFMDAVAGAVYTSGQPLGHFPLSLVEKFSTGPADSGVGNFHRFLLAMDMAASRFLGPNELPTDRHARAYIESLRRMEQHRLALHQRLAELQFEVVAIPSISHALRSINYVNGIHAPGHYLMPAYGGIYARLDEAAAEALRNTLAEDIEITPILCAESQCRAGAIHCSAAPAPAP